MQSWFIPLWLSSNWLYFDYCLGSFCSTYVNKFRTVRSVLQRPTNWNILIEFSNLRRFPNHLIRFRLGWVLKKRFVDSQLSNFLFCFSLVYLFGNYARLGVFLILKNISYDIFIVLEKFSISLGQDIVIKMKLQLNAFKIFKYISFLTCLVYHLTFFFFYVSIFNFRY